MASDGRAATLYHRKADPVEAMQWNPADASMQVVMSWLRDEGQVFKTVGRQLWIEAGDGDLTMVVHPGDYVIRRTTGDRRCLGLVVVSSIRRIGGKR